MQEYLGMNFDFTEKSKAKINIDNYVERMINYFPKKISNSDPNFTPNRNNLKNVTAK